MLYLHGGPGFSTSYADWAITRKLADDYTVVSWDQRDCAKTWINDPKGTEITPEVMREDLVVMVDFLLDYFDTDKITFLGMSWGTYYGCDYALTYPDKVECIINLSQCVDEKESALAVKQYLLEQTENNPEDHKLAEEYDPLFFFQIHRYFVRGAGKSRLCDGKSVYRIAVPVDPVRAVLGKRRHERLRIAVKIVTVP